MPTRSVIMYHFMDFPDTPDIFLYRQWITLFFWISAPSSTTLMLLGSTKLLLRLISDTRGMDCSGTRWQALKAGSSCKQGEPDCARRPADGWMRNGRKLSRSRRAYAYTKQSVEMLYALNASTRPGSPIPRQTCQQLKAHHLLKLKSTASPT